MDHISDFPEFIQNRFRYGLTVRWIGKLPMKPLSFPRKERTRFLRVIAHRDHTIKNLPLELIHML